MNESIMENEQYKTALDLLYLVSCSVNGEIPDRARCAEMDFGKVFKMALGHSLTVVSALALEQVTPLPENYREEKFKCIRRLSLFEVEWSSILDLFEQNGIWYLPLKGIVMKRYYRKSSMREMGDNDILFDAARADDVKRIMESLGYTCKKFGRSNHDVYQKHDELFFEMHKALFSSSSMPQFISFFEDIKSRLLPDGTGQFAYRMSHEDFYLFLICHLYKHYSRTGTGLRSLLDVYVFNKYFENKTDADYLLGALEQLQLSAFERDIRQLAEKVFTNQPLSEDEQNELMFFVTSGCQGTKDNLMANSLHNDDSRKAKYRYVVNRLKLSDGMIKDRYPKLYRHKIFYPVLAVYRPVAGVIKKPKVIAGELKRLVQFRKKENTGMHNDE